MKKLPYIIGIPFIAVALVLGGAMLWRLQPQTVDSVVLAHPAPRPNPLLRNAAGTKPTNPFNVLFSQPTSTVTPIPTPTPASAAALNSDVNSVGDDGGAADFNSLNAQVNGL